MKKVLRKILSIALATSVVMACFTATAFAATTSVGVSYSAHVQDIGWQAAVTDGATAGTSGQSKRVEALKVSLTNAPAGAHINYQVHVQDHGWMSVASDGALAGTTGESKRIEAIAMTISGVTGYTLEYRVHVQDIGWMNWVSGGSITGTVGQSKRIEAIQIRLVSTTPIVTSVAGINGTQFEVKFNQAVDPATIFADLTGTNPALKPGVVAITSLDGVALGTLTGALSTDQKTLTITSSAVLKNRYLVNIDAIKTTGAVAVTKFSDVVSFAADTTAPSIVSTTKLTASTYKVTFSEPLNLLGAVSYQYVGGSAILAGITNDFVAGAKSVVFTLDGSITVNKQIAVTFIAASDLAGNLIVPNPASTSFIKGDKDGVAPTVTSVAQTGAKQISVKFSEELIATPAISMTGYTVSTITKDTTDPTLYNVVFTAPFTTGLQTVAVGAATDNSGEVGTAITKVLSLVQDAVAPKVVSSVVTVDSTDRKEYLQITFDKDVVLAGPAVNATGSFVKDYVTTNLAAPLSAIPAFYPTTSNAKIIRVDLDTFLGAAATDVKAAVYSLNLTFTGITSVAGIVADGASATFTRGEDGVAANTNKVAVLGIAQGADNNKVAVTFNQAVDGASAVATANYSVGGAVVSSVTLMPVSGVTQVAVLNLLAGSNTFTGLRNISVSNVKALGSSVAMDAYTQVVPLNENVVPTITALKLLTATTVQVTFSEAVTTTAVATEYVLYIGGVASATTVTGVAATGTTEVLTLGTAVTAANLTSGLTLKQTSAGSIAAHDAAGNLVTLATATSIAQ